MHRRRRWPARAALLLAALMVVPLAAVAAPYVGPSSLGTPAIHTLPGAGGTAIGIAANGYVATTLAVWTGIGYPEPVPVPTVTGTNFAITDINNHGTVAGWYVAPETGQRRAFVWTPGEPAITDLGNPGMVLEASGIDDDGRVVGRFTAGAGVCGATAGQCGFILRPDAGGSYGLIESIGATPSGGRFLPLDIGGGLVVSSAWTWDATAADATSRWQSLLDPQGGTLAQGVAVDESRRIAGHWVPSQGVTEALYWPRASTGPIRLGTLAGDAMSQSHGIGEDGSVTGWSAAAATGPRRAWVWDGDAVTELGHIPGGSATADAFDAGNGLVVGTASGRAVIWDLAGGFDIDYPPEIVIETSVEVRGGELVEIVPTITDHDGDAFTVVCTDIPADASCDPDGVITWQTDEADIAATPYLLTLAATQDSVPANVHVVRISFLVRAGVFLHPIGDQQGAAGELLTFTAAAGGDSQPSFSYAPALAGASMDPVSGVFTWAPSLAQVGDHEITVTVFGGATRTSDSETLTLSVVDPVEPPGPVTISVAETIGVVGAVTMRGPVVIAVSEAIGVVDTVTAQGPVVIAVSETIVVSDAAAVRPPVVISVGETIGIADVVSVRPPVVITIGETVGVDDAVVLHQDAPVVISITESVGVADTVVVRPPVVIAVTESVGVVDTVSMVVEPSVTVGTILEYLATLDDADFRSGAGSRRALERLVAAADRSLAAVVAALARVDGCGDVADPDDLIVDCDAQREVRRLLRLLNAPSSSAAVADARHRAV